MFVDWFSTSKVAVDESVGLLLVILLFSCFGTEMNQMQALSSHFLSSNVLKDFLVPADISFSVQYRISVITFISYSLSWSIA